VIVDSAIYVDGRRSAPCPLHETRERCREQGGFAWVTLYRPTPGELAAVAAEFGLPEAALENTGRPHHRPRVEDYGGILSVALKTARYHEQREEVEFRELHNFLGLDFVLTLHSGERDELEEVRRRVEEEPRLLRRGPSAVLYALLDRVVEDYEPVVEGLEEDIDQVEEEVFEGRPAETRVVSRRLYKLSREVIQFHQAVQPLAAALDRLPEGGFDEEVRGRLQVLRERVLRTSERVAGFRELLTNVLSVNLTLIGVNQNDQMKKISGWGAIVIVPALIAGIYGMNFDYMPELHWRYGYLLALSLMALVALVLYLGLRRSGWL
jgi:magnesium transporter